MSNTVLIATVIELQKLAVEDDYDSDVIITYQFMITLIIGGDKIRRIKFDELLDGKFSMYGEEQLIIYSYVHGDMILFNVKDILDPNIKEMVVGRFQRLFHPEGFDNKFFFVKNHTSIMSFTVIEDQRGNILQRKFNFWSID